MSDEMKKVISNANSMDEIRKVAEKIPEVKQHFMESLKLAKQLLTDIFSRLILKGEPYKWKRHVPQDSLDVLFKSVQEIEPSLKITDAQQVHLKKPQLVQFMHGLSEGIFSA